MKIIKENKEIILEINKSKFIGIIKKVDNLEEIKSILFDIKEKHPNATHICYAYILPNNKKYYDDGEPTNTAGLPILEVLEKNNLNDVLAVVIRYFGGIKLGANGLIRAYTKAITMTLNDNIKELEYGYKIKIIEDYQKSEKIKYLLKNSLITNITYQDKVIIDAIIKKEVLNYLSNLHYEIIEEIII